MLGSDLSALPELSILLPFALALVVIGGIAGVVGGLLGVGGGIVLVPAFFYCFQALGYGGDQLMQICVATSLATIIITSFRSVASHNRKGAVEWSVLKSWGPWLALSAACGVYVASLVSSNVLQGIFGGIMGLVALWMAFGRDDRKVSDQMPKGFARAAMASATGFLSAMMGIGGGSFGVPLLALHGLPIHRAVGTASGFGALIAIPAVIGFLLLQVDDAPPFSIGAVNLPAFLVVIGTTLLTTPLGVKLAHAMNPRPLKRAFAIFLALMALNMLRKVLFA